MICRPSLSRAPARTKRRQDTPERRGSIQGHATGPGARAGLRPNRLWLQAGEGAQPLQQLGLGGGVERRGLARSGCGFRLRLGIAPVDLVGEAVAQLEALAV